MHLLNFFNRVVRVPFQFAKQTAFEVECDLVQPGRCLMLCMMDSREIAPIKVIYGFAFFAGLLQGLTEPFCQRCCKIL